MPIISKSVAIQCSQKTVFDTLTDWESQASWMLGTSVKAVSSNGHEVGGKLEARTGLNKLGFVDTMTITTWQPPRQCSVLHTGRIVRGSGDFIITELSDESALFTWKEVIDLPFGLVGRVGWPLVRPFARLGIVLSLRRFKRWVENQ